MLTHQLATRKILLPLCFLLLFAASAIAQTSVPRQKVNYAGKDFWLSVRQSTTLMHHEFYISGANDANISFNYTATGTTQNYFMQGGSVLKIILTPAEYIAFSSVNMEVVSNASLHITSDTDVVVQFVAWGAANDDGIVLFPTENQDYGDDYYLNGARHTGGIAAASETGTFSIVATCSAVTLEITPKVSTANHPANVPFLLSLDAGETYILAVNNNNVVRDLSGTRIRIVQAACCNPINVFMSYPSTYVFWPIPPNGTAPGCCADQMIEQMLPVNTWDTVHAALPFVNNSYDNIKIVSASAGNTVFFDGVPVKNINQGGTFDTAIRQPVIITSLYPVSITQYMVSQSEFSHPPAPTSDDSLSDPSALWLIPLRDGIRESYFMTVGQSEWSGSQLQAYNTLHALTLISPATNISSIQLDNVSLASQFSPFPNAPDLMYAYIRPDTVGIHHLVSAAPIIAYYYAAAPMASIAYPLGDIEASPLIKNPVLNPVEDTLFLCEQDMVTLSATPADSYAWSNGAQTQSIQVATPGLYYVHRRFANSCLGATDMFRVIAKNYEETARYDTLYKCADETITLVADPAANTVFWSTGSTAPQISVTDLGSYQATETYQSNCERILHRFIVLPRPPYIPSINLGADTLICDGDQFLVSAGSVATWSTGEVGMSIVVSQPGTYWAAVEDTCLNTTIADTIFVDKGLCPERFCTLVFPTAFSPNGDGRNDLFRPVARGAFTGYFFAVYNRWGERVFQSYKETEGWDGTYKGSPAEVGYYYYLCNYECPLKGNISTKGDIMLVR